MAQSPTDTRLGSLGLLVGAGMLAYSYFHSRKGIGPLAATAGAATAGVDLGALDHWASTHGLRLESNSPGDYVLLPQPGWTIDVPGIADSATKAGFPATASGGQVHVAVPYGGK
jgi:hypothetical protein